jgi:hypothetical protein
MKLYYFNITYILDPAHAPPYIMRNMVQQAQPVLEDFMN